MEVPEWLLAAYPNRTLAEPTAIGRSNAIFFCATEKPNKGWMNTCPNIIRQEVTVVFSWNVVFFRILTSKIVRK
jgi:hypothetical protein